MGLFSKLFGNGSEKPRRRGKQDSEWEGGGEAGFRRRFERIVAEEWPGYELVKNVPADRLGAAPGARDYSYGIYWNGSPRAMIMILNDTNDYRKRDVVMARRACEAQGIPYMNYMAYFQNRADYISNRLREQVR